MDNKPDLSAFVEEIKAMSDMELIIMQNDLKRFEEDKPYRDAVLKELLNRPKKILNKEG